MPVPACQQKHKHESLLNPADFLAYLRKTGRAPNFKPPHGIIFCYQPSLPRYAEQKYKTSKHKFFSDVRIFSANNKTIGVVSNFGIGSPAAVALLEELIALGTKNYISIGAAGALDRKAKIGDILVCSKALRDEGTSHHYLPRAKFAAPSSALTAALKKEFSSAKIAFKTGATWTTDAPYRETAHEARLYEKQGIKTVEMEAAALFAAAKYRKTDMAAAFAVSDILGETNWQPDFSSRDTEQSLQTIMDTAVRALSTFK